MNISQIVEIPANRRLILEVPRDVPIGQVSLIYKPVKIKSHIPNATTMAALNETSSIMSGKKKVKWNRFQTGMSKTEAKKELKKVLVSK